MNWKQLNALVEKYIPELMRVGEVEFMVGDNRVYVCYKGDRFEVEMCGKCCTIEYAGTTSYRRHVVKGIARILVKPDHPSVKPSKSIPVVEGGGRAVAVNLQKLIYALIDYYEEMDDPVTWMYNTINVATGRYSGLVNRETIENAWENGGASELMKLIILTHYRGRPLKTEKSSFYVDDFEIANQAKVVKDGWGAKLAQ